MQTVLSIDIGIVNLGYTLVEIENRELRVIECNRVDITRVQHNRVARCNCNLYHENCIPDYLDHFIQENQEIFDRADQILIERQPPVGITNVQDLIFTRFRNKVKLVSPNSVHKHFKMTRNDYETRKQESLTITQEYLKDFYNFQTNIRKHDICDSLLLVLYYLESNVNCQQNVEKFEFLEQFRLTTTFPTTTDLPKILPNFEQFRFKV